VLYLTLGAILYAFGGALFEIDRIVDPTTGPPTRILRFVDDNNYVEPEWKVIAFTSGFVVLRRQADGFIQVRNRADLKRVDSVPIHE
jgi:hypothetical protein